MTPRRLFVEQVLPALERFKAGYADREIGLGRDIARGADLADLLVNLPDYIFREPSQHSLLAPNKNARAYREEFCWKQNSNYEIACDFANSWKHRKVTRDHRKVNGMSDVHEAYAMCRYVDSQGDYYCGHKIVVISTVDGQTADLRRMLVSSARFWAEELSRLGVIPPTPPERFDFGEYTSRSEAVALGPLKFHGIAGEPLRYEARTFDFDASTRSWINSRPSSGFHYEMPCVFEIAPSPFKQ